MSDPRPEELIKTEELMYNGKVEEALEKLNNFENYSELIPKERLWALLLRGWSYVYKMRYRRAVEVGEHAYLMSKELGMESETIDALIIKARMDSLGKFDEANEYLLEAENLLASLEEKTPHKHLKLEYGILFSKANIYRVKGNYNKALEVSIESLDLGKKIGNKIMVAYNYLQLSGLNLIRGNPNVSLDHALKGLELFKEINFQTGLAMSLKGLGSTHLFKGDLDQALEFTNQSLSHRGISKATKNQCMVLLGAIYRKKGELNKSLKYLKQAEYEEYLNIGITYRLMGDLDMATAYLEKSFTRGGSGAGVMYQLTYLVLLSLDKGDHKQAQQYLNDLKNLNEQSKNKLGTQAYQLAKAAVLRTSNRRRNLAEAEILLKQIVDDEIIEPEFTEFALIFLCDLLLDELSVSNNPEIFDEINILIKHLLNIGELQHSFSWIAEGKLFQAKLALIQMNLEEAKSFLTEAQQIAEEHGLNFLAQNISSEHDILLQKFDEWDKLKKEDAPMEKRIELASVDGVIERLQGKRAVEPPELLDEEPILLLIMDNSGATYFNHPFVADWDYSDLFSSFMSAFNNFTSEIFSNSIDRIKVKENTILINPIEPFLACYIIKGQSYPALKKLTKFTEAIRENSEIWEALNKAVKTSEMLELDKPPVLKSVINEIFN